MRCPCDEAAASPIGIEPARVRLRPRDYSCVVARWRATSPPWSLARSSFAESKSDR